jgi:hypothetical protein
MILFIVGFMVGILAILMGQYYILSNDEEFCKRKDER